MQYFKKTFLFSAIVFFLLFLISFKTIAFAVPGQLNYDINTPPQPTVDSSCNENLAICKKESENTNILYQTCQLEKSQLGKTNMILVVALMVVIVSAAVTAIVIVFLKKKSSNLT